MSVILRPAASRFAYAAALVAGAAIGLTAIASPAHAQRNKSEKADAKAAAKVTYSKEFVALYQPFAKASADGGDVAALAVQVPAIIAAAQTPDDRLVAGQVAYNTGVKTQSIALQRQGLDLMIDSGKVAPAQIGQNYYAAAQLAYGEKDWATARARAQQSIDANYAGDAELLIAETYFAENQSVQGLDLIDRAIAKKIAAGQPIPQDWIKRGLAMSYEAGLEPQATKYGAMYAQYYPTATSWGDAIAIQRNFNDFEGQELLDLMRLAERAKALRTERDYVDYISAADARRLPGETQRIIDAGVSAGLLKSNDVFVNEARTIASGRVKADLADLPSLERDARNGNATAATAMAAGDAFLSYQQPAKAEEFYAMALAKPGVDTARVLTRLGIAQLDQGKAAEAEASFAKVEGARQAIARLWGLYAAQSGLPATAPAE